MFEEWHIKNTQPLIDAGNQRATDMYEWNNFNTNENSGYNYESNDKLNHIINP